MARRKLYESIQDPDAESLDQIRIKDASGDDCHPKELPIPVELSSNTEKAVISAL